MSSLLQHLAQWKPFDVLVVGDFMLDRLVYGDVDRLCADAPVPVLAVQRTEERCGGASNVCVDLAAIRGRVRAFGVAGEDAHGAALRQALRDAGVDDSGLVADPSRPTTTKQSLIGLAQHRHAQKMFRIDYESKRPLDRGVEDRLLERIGAALGGLAPGAGVVCLEDYNKGVCTPRVCAETIRLARARGVEVLVDPAAVADYGKYRGCTTMTPNRNEAELATGSPRGEAPEDYAPIAARLLDDLAMDVAIVTLDKHGAMLLERGPGGPRVVPTVARRVYDVTGAGDMVLAALAGARANGIGWFDAVRFANAAAGLEVEEFGVVPIALERIHRDILQRERATRGKRRTVEELQVELAALRGTGAGPRPTVVFANGCFDVLHAGHVSLLRRAAALGDYLVVATNDDAGIRRLKGPGRPVYSEADRVELLGELEAVDAVVVFADETPEALVRALKPDVLVKGAQYAEDSIPGAAFVKEHGGRVALLEIVEGRSTTGTVAKIRGG